MDLPTFNFSYLYYEYMPSLANDSDLFTHPYNDSSIRTLTYHGCVEAVGTSSQFYTRQDVYDRVLLWRIPLIALWATTTLPGLGWHTKVFTLIHLIADPIDTFWSLFYKLDLARRNARWARHNDKATSLQPKFTFPSEFDALNEMDHPMLLARRQTTIGNQDSKAFELRKKLRDRDKGILQYYQDVIALVIDAYDEWGLGVPALEAINYGFCSERWTVTQRADLRDRCASAAFYIASDRVSRFLPSIISTIVFLSQVAAAFWKTLSALDDTYDESNAVSRGLNRAPHNIAFSVLFFWLPFAVLMTAFVGGSQTSHFAPRVLERFRFNVHESWEDQHLETGLDSGCEKVEFPSLDEIMDQRWAHGGLPVWQTAKFKKVRRMTAPSKKVQNDIQTEQPPRVWGLLIALAIVTIPTGCAMAVSWLTPPQGFGCRAVTHLGFLGSWLINLGLDWLIFVLLSWNNDKDEDHETSPLREHGKVTFRKLRRVYWVTFLKDSVFASGTIILLTFTALGIFNNCGCWCKWTFRSVISSQARYLSFPQEPIIFDQIKDQLRYTFPHYIGFALLSQIILFIIVAIYFKEGWRVLKQRDIDAALEGPSYLVRLWRHCQQWLTDDHSSKLDRPPKPDITSDMDDTYRLRPILLTPLNVDIILLQETAEED